MMAKKKSKVAEAEDLEDMEEKPISKQRSKLVQVRVLRKKGNSAVVTYRDKDDKRRAVLLPGSFIGEIPGKDTEVEEEVLERGADYGLDWDVIFPDGIFVESSELGNMLFDRGVYTVEDLRDNPQAFQDAIQQLTRKLSKQVQRTVKEVLGG